MATCDIQVANPSLLNKIESFLNDPSYKETIENSANYNTRLCVERRMRMPFLDSQTGVAQNHSNLFMNARQRLPGLVEGQIYSYPSKRWRKKRRQYLMTFMQPRRKELDPESDLHTISTVENPAALNEDSKDSMHLKDETAKDAWYYDELDMQDVEGYDDPDPDSDYDYEESYSKRKRRRGGKMSRGGGRGRKKATTPSYDINFDAEKPFACELCGARYKTRPGLTYHYTHSHKDRDDEEDDSSSANNSSSLASSSGGGSSAMPAAATSSSSPKPARDTPITGAMTMGSVGIMGGGGVIGGSGIGAATVAVPGASNGNPIGPGGGEPSGISATGWNLPSQQHQYFHPQQYQQQQHQALRDSVGLPKATAAASPGNTRRGRQPATQPPTGMGPVGTDDPLTSMMGERKKPVAATSSSSGPMMEDSASSGTPGSGGGPGVEFDRHKPSTYCDFCLGDATQNKKTGQSEELVSCSDCGRSGHPTCLQFTANMIISVRKYRWQCIECKCCSLCGNSDNDDQLLFCDDCDRGYHMYCLTPPLSSPPEGSWSCVLCIDEFHKNK